MTRKYVGKQEHGALKSVSPASAAAAACLSISSSSSFIRNEKQTHRT